MSTKPEAKAPKPVNGWAIVDPDGAIQMVEACDSDRFIWRKYTKPVSTLSTFTQADYERLGYRCIRVSITPLP